MPETRKYTLQDYDYDLPPERIAQYPLHKRSDSRMLVVDVARDALEASRFNQLEQYLRPHDLLVLNDTKVVPARLYGCKQTGGKLECLIERFLEHNRVLAHIKSSKSPKPGSQLLLAQAIEVTVVSRQGDLFELQFPMQRDIFAWLGEYGHMPLPPYIHREANDHDCERYQTVFAKHPGAVAAPTAGLHFDQSTLDRLREKGVAIATVTLHVGAGTFQPVRGDNLDEHHMHSEVINVSDEVCEAVRHCRQQGGRVIAVGTTVCRSLEAASQEGELRKFSGETDIFIKQGFKFNCVDTLITNFHLPKSTLLVLVSAFAGHNLMKNAYQFALQQDFRFFSYGDLMLIVK